MSDKTMSDDALISYGAIMGRFVMANKDLHHDMREVREKVGACLDEIEERSLPDVSPCNATRIALKTMEDCLDGVISNFEHIADVNGINPHDVEFHQRRRMTLRDDAD